MNSDYIYSVIIPCYNVEKYIRRCFESIFNNNISSCELIIVNDGATDDTKSIIYDYFNYDGEDQKIITISLDNSVCVKILNKENGGLSNARNVALDIARGKYIIFVDPDDYVKEDWFDTICSSLVSEPDMLIMGYIMNMYNEHEELFQTEIREPHEKYDLRSNKDVMEILFPKYAGHSIDNILKWANDSKKLHELSEFGSVWRVIYKRSLIINNGIRFDEKIKLNEDGTFNMCCLCYAQTVCSVPDAVYCYESRNSGLLNTVKRNADMSDALIHNKLCLLHKREEIAKQYQKLTGIEIPLSVYAGSNVLSILELFAKYPLHKWNKVKLYLKECGVKKAVDIMPLTKKMSFTVPLIFMKLHMYFFLFVVVRVLKKCNFNIQV